MSDLLQTTLERVGFILYYRFKYSYRRPDGSPIEEVWSLWTKCGNYKIYATEDIAKEAASYISQHSGPVQFRVTPLFIDLKLTKDL